MLIALLLRHCDPCAGLRYLIPDHQQPHGYHAEAQDRRLHHTVSRIITDSIPILTELAQIHGGSGQGNQRDEAQPERAGACRSRVLLDCSASRAVLFPYLRSSCLQFNS